MPISNTVRYAPGFNPNQKKLVRERVLIFLKYKFARVNPWVFRGEVENLAEQVNVLPSSVAREMRKMFKAGLIERDLKKGKTIYSHKPSFIEEI